MGALVGCTVFFVVLVIMTFIVENVMGYGKDD